MKVLGIIGNGLPVMLQQRKFTFFYYYYTPCFIFDPNKAAVLWFFGGCHGSIGVNAVADAQMLVAPYVLYEGIVFLRCKILFGDDEVVGGFCFFTVHSVLKAALVAHYNGLWGVHDMRTIE